MPESDRFLQAGRPNNGLRREAPSHLTWTSLDLPAATVLPCTVENPDDSLMPAGFPNDAFFKEMFSDPPRAIAFFQSHLPPAIVAKVDWPTLKVLPSSFIKSGLQQVPDRAPLDLRAPHRQRP
jgi:hypothetical protein